MRLTDYVEKRDQTREFTQLVFQFVLALGISWLVAGAIAGCAVDQVHAYQTIRTGMR